MYSSPNIVRVFKSSRMRRVENVACMGEERGVYMVLVGRPRCRGEDNIKMDVREIGMDGVNWICLAQDRVWWQDIFLHAE
jgi:hypothetical protein